MELLIIEDDVRISGLLKTGLEENGFAVQICYDGLHGKSLALQRDFALVITDVMLPGISGVELCKHLKVQKPNLPVLMLTALGTTDEKLMGFDAGADDYLVKPFDFRELLARIKALLKRNDSLKQVPETDSLQYADLIINKKKREVTRHGQLIDLTPKEFNLLQYMLENTETVLTREKIASAVWDTHYDTGTNFIDVYINYLRKKIDKPFEPKLIHTKPGIGFILEAK